MDEIALFLLETLRQRYAHILQEKYRLTLEQIEQEPTVELLLLITKQMGLKDDYELASERLVFDYRQNKLGNLTLDIPYVKVDVNDELND